MKKFKDIHNVNESEVTLDNYIIALGDLQSAAKDKKHPLVTSRALKTYYENAISLGNKKKFISKKLRLKINKLNKDFNELGDKHKREEQIVIDNLEIIISDLKVQENSSINGMGEVSLPDLDGKIGSGDIPKSFLMGDDEEEDEDTLMLKFDDIKEAKKDNEIYFPISSLGDPAKLLQEIAKELSKKNSVTHNEIIGELLKIQISYNGLVDIKSIHGLANVIFIDSKDLKIKIDNIITKNLELLETLQVNFLEALLEGNLNESIIGRTLGGVVGLALGPKIGRTIAKVLGIEKGPLYNVLTSRIVSGALAQELTKNLI